MRKVEFKYEEYGIPSSIYRGIDLNKLTFPCLCSFITTMDGRQPGIIMFDDDDGYHLYYTEIPNHYDSPITNSCEKSKDLRGLLNMWDVEWENGVIIYDNY